MILSRLLSTLNPYPISLVNHRILFIRRWNLVALWDVVLPDTIRSHRREISIACEGWDICTDLSFLDLVLLRLDMINLLKISGVRRRCFLFFVPWWFEVGCCCGNRIHSSTEIWIGLCILMLCSLNSILVRGNNLVLDWGKTFSKIFSSKTMKRRCHQSFVALKQVLELFVIILALEAENRMLISLCSFSTLWVHDRVAWIKSRYQFLKLRLYLILRRCGSTAPTARLRQLLRLLALLASECATPEVISMRVFASDPVGATTLEDLLCLLSCHLGLVNRIHHARNGHQLVVLLLFILSLLVLTSCGCWFELKHLLN